MKLKKGDPEKLNAIMRILLRGGMFADNEDCLGEIGISDQDFVRCRGFFRQYGGASIVNGHLEEDRDTMPFLCEDFFEETYREQYATEKRDRRHSRYLAIAFWATLISMILSTISIVTAIIKWTY